MKALIASTLTLENTHRHPLRLWSMVIVGRCCRPTNPDALRHPASPTKIMTLYLLFERLERGRIHLDTPLKVSEHASKQAPTKLGLQAGQTITVEAAIKSMVTKSANDAAVVVAENLGGEEGNFAKLMTQRARALGITRTTYMNASGLPDDDQVTTARDQALLGRAIQEHFPRYYKYFSTERIITHYKQDRARVRHQPPIRCLPHVRLGPNSDQRAEIARAPFSAT